MGQNRRLRNARFSLGNFQAFEIISIRTFELSGFRAIKLSSARAFERWFIAFVRCVGACVRRARIFRCRCGRCSVFPKETSQCRESQTPTRKRHE